MSHGQDDDRVWIMDPDVLDAPETPTPVQRRQHGVTFAAHHNKFSLSSGAGALDWKEATSESTPFFPVKQPTMKRGKWEASSQRRQKTRAFARPAASTCGGAAQREPELTLAEKQYLLSCERGDLASVRHYLNVAHTTNTLNVNCLDPLGRSALLIAIENENVEMIETLLESNIETGDAILYAINEENVEAVEIILCHLEKIDKFSTETQGVEINEHSAFTPDITPIILASHRDNYEIVKLLLDRGASIPHPHDVRCDCDYCLQAMTEDSLRLSRSRIHAYRALASPSLICLSARDPILYAFELSWELRRLAYIENEFRNEYQELSHKCQKFSTDLLDQTRGSKELEIILNHDTTDRWPLRDRAPGERMQLTRLKLAVQFRQKKFVSHANCQQLLASIWYEGLPGFRRRNIIFKVLLILSVSLAFPFLAAVYLVAPKTSIGQVVRKPFIKFLCSSASYCFFLFLLILASQRINYDELFSGGKPSGQGYQEDRKERRGLPPSPVEWAIMLYVAGLIWVEIKLLWDVGLYEYGHNLWNILDFITNSLYLCTITLRVIAYIQVEIESANPSTSHLARKLPRKSWNAWDPTLISECIFATANIFSSMKLVHIFTINPHLGPLQISLGRMVLDIMKFFFVYSLVLFAFACGLNQLFWYYATMRAQECDLSKGPMDGLSESQKRNLEESCDPRFSSCGNLFNTLETLFWAAFGIVGLERFEIKENHYFTQWAGKTMFGTYNTIAIVVLLNMLIAMMSSSYALITLQKILKAVSQKEANYQKTQRRVNERDAKFQFVMRNLVKRYIAHIQKIKQRSEGVSEDDVNEIKQDISAFRFELLEILRNAGMNTGHANISQKNTRSKRRSAQAERRLMKGFQINPIEPIPEVPASKRSAESNPVGHKLQFASVKATQSSPAISSTFARLKKLSSGLKLPGIAKRLSGDGAKSSLGDISDELADKFDQTAGSQFRGSASEQNLRTRQPLVHGGSKATFQLDSTETLRPVSVVSNLNRQDVAPPTYFQSLTDKPSDTIQDYSWETRSEQTFQDNRGTTFQPEDTLL